MKNPKFVARKLLCKYNCQDIEELLSKIIRNENIQLDYWPLIDVSGMFWHGIRGGKPTIVINSQKPKDKQIIIMAHMLGHYFLDHGSQFCCLGQNTRIDMKEKQANEFATELLERRKIFAEKLA